MGSQTEYIFQKPGLKKSMENGMFVVKYCMNSENRTASPQPKIPRSIPYPPARALKK